MSRPFLLGIDQGTSGSKAVILDREGQVHGYGSVPLERLYPRPGRVEQDPHAVAAGVARAITLALGQAGCSADQIAACGITSQRNTEFAWDKRTGHPLANAITWQDLRTIDILHELQQWPSFGEARHRLGYEPGTYMAAVHLAWRMRFDQAVMAAARSGTLRLGLSAAWLVQALGHPSAHLMDTSLVQAMGLYDFRAATWWHPWLAQLGVPVEALPAAVPTIHDFGTLQIAGPDGRTAAVPVLAMIGDQQAALFGHTRRLPGDAECTHGTASYIKVFLGPHAPRQEKVNVYNAWHLGDRQTFCLEAATSVTGAAIRWLRDNARLFDRYDQMDQLAAGVPDSGGVVFVPAFTGLEVPHNDPQARATLFGLTLGHDRGHIARAFFEAVAFQMRTILETIDAQAGVRVARLLVGGGVSASDLACQIQADLLAIPVQRPTFTETTAWSAGLLAGLGAGFWDSADSLPALPGEHHTFTPSLSDTGRDAAYDRWQYAVRLVQAWGAGTPPLVDSP
jgi:glycerol kinase